MNNVDPKIIERAKSWLTEQYDEETRKSVQNMLDNDPNELGRTGDCMCRPCSRLSSLSG